MASTYSRRSAASCDEEIPRKLRLMAERASIKSVSVWARSGDAPDRFNVVAEYLDDGELPDGYSVESATDTSHPNYHFTKYTVKRDHLTER